MTLTRREFIASLAGLTALGVARPAAACGPGSVYGLAATVMADCDTPPLEDHAVLIRDSRIEAVVPVRTVSDRPLTRLPGATIIPGIINAHCHRVHTPEERNVRWLKHGVTAIGDVGAPLAAMATLTTSPKGVTATAACSGPMLTPPGGYPLPVHSPDHALVVHSPREGEEAVQRLKDNGATMIKLSFEPGVMPNPWPMFDSATARAITRTARRLGLVVRCHVEDLAGLEPALDAGVHTVEHVPYRWSRDSTPQPVLTRDSTVIPYYRKLLERMVRDGVTMTPTLDVLSRSPWNGPSLYEPVRAFHRMGGRLAVGNDFPYRRTEAGMVRTEFRLLGRAGIDNRGILTAATTGAAKACGFGDKGKIAKGMAADLLVVQGDPTQDLDVLSHPVHIIKDGTIVK